MERSPSLHPPGKRGKFSLSVFFERSKSGGSQSYSLRGGVVGMALQSRGRVDTARREQRVEVRQGWLDQSLFWRLYVWKEAFGSMEAALEVEGSK